MRFMQHKRRLHPLVAVAAGAVTLFSLVGIAAITGLLPSSHGSVPEGSRETVQTMDPPVAVTLAQPQASTAQAASKTPKPVHHASAGGGSVAAQDSSAQVATAPAAPAAPVAAQKPAAQNSAVGIGVGAVIGGVLGNQVGRGDGKTLATILGAVGGGYIGNEVAKKNQ